MIMETRFYNLKIKTIVSLLIVMAITASCKKEEYIPTVDDEVKNFIFTETKNYYLWDEFIPAGINIKNYQNPEDLFEAMMYRKLDKWSFVSNDYKGILSSLDGVRKTTGYLMRIGLLPGNSVYGIIEYIYKGGPADLAGLKRGDLVYKVNGQLLTTSNYQSLLNAETADLGLGKLENGAITDLNRQVSLTSAVSESNPVAQFKIIEIDGKKTGYLLYNQFVEKNKQDLETAITNFKSEGIQDLVLDLRYNPGGYVSTCAALASMVAPANSVGKVLFSNIYNKGITEYISATYGAYNTLFITEFPATTISLGLSRIFILNSSRSASASESLANGLKPYMQVVTIGNKTAGKYTGATLIYDENSVTNTWGIYITLSKIANANGETDFVEGLVPNYQVNDDYTTPLGETSEPLLAKALELIYGAPAKKSISDTEYHTIDILYENSLQKEGMMVLDAIKAKK
jgi:carboxyl-terminal processing protease